MIPSFWSASVAIILSGPWFAVVDVSVTSISSDILGSILAFCSFSFSSDTSFVDFVTFSLFFSSYFTSRLCKWTFRNVGKYLLKDPLIWSVANRGHGLLDFRRCVAAMLCHLFAITGLMRIDWLTSASHGIGNRTAIVHKRFLPIIIALYSNWITRKSYHGQCKLSHAGCFYFFFLLKWSPFTSRPRFVFWSISDCAFVERSLERDEKCEKLLEIVCDFTASKTHIEFDIRILTFRLSFGTRVARWGAPCDNFASVNRSDGILAARLTSYLTVLFLSKRLAINR